MAKVNVSALREYALFMRRREQFAVPEGSTLAGSARTAHPSGVPMSGGAEPAGAAKHPECHE